MTDGKAKAKQETASRILEAVHEIATDLCSAGFIDERKMRRYDELCNQAPKG